MQRRIYGRREVKRWRQKAVDREEWTSVIDEGRIAKGGGREGGRK